MFCFPSFQLGLLAQLPEEGEATPESSSAATLKEEEGGGGGRDDPGPSEPLVLLTLSRRSPPPVQVPDSSSSFSSSLQGASKERRGSGEDGTSGRASATADAQVRGYILIGVYTYLRPIYKQFTYIRRVIYFFINQQLMVSFNQFVDGIFSCFPLPVLDPVLYNQWPAGVREDQHGCCSAEQGEVAGRLQGCV